MLFNTNDLLPHGSCILWRPDLLLLHVGSDAMIGLAYFSIPLALAYFVRRRQELRYRWVFWMFVTFITACGATHLFSIYTLWTPAYGVEGLLKAVTAVVSVGTSVMLWWTMPAALAIPGRIQLEELNTSLETQIRRKEDAEAEIRRLNAELERRVEGRTRELSEANARLAHEVAERERSEKRQQLIAAELDHRVRNSLALIQSIARLAGRPAATKEAFVEAICGRIDALARAHGHLTQSHWRGAGLGSVIEDELQPYFGPAGMSRVNVDGPELLLRPSSAVSLALVVHELATNAAKHGALSAPGGAVAVSWAVSGPGPDGKLTLEWTETDGPAVTEPTRKGFGSRLIENVFKGEFGGGARIDYAPEGIRFTATLPLSHVIADEGRAPDIAHPPSAATPAPSWQAGGARILLVEDDVLVGLGMADAMESLDAVAVGPFGRVDEAAEALRDAPVAAALLDVSLDGTTSYPLADFLVARGIPFAFMTGYGRDYLPERFRDALLLRKPVSDADLSVMLRQLLAGG